MMTLFDIIKVSAEEGYPSMPSIVEFTTEDLEFIFDIVKGIVTSLMPIILVVIGVLIGVLVVGYIIKRFTGES